MQNDLLKLEWFGRFTEHREIIANAFHRQQLGENVMLVAESRDFPIGQVWTDMTRARHKGAGYIWAMRVLPEFRGAGLGARLLAAAEEVIAGHGLGIAELGVETHNLAAQRFYQRHGYRIVGRLEESYSFTTPAGVPVRVELQEWVMQKRLQ